jgi:hypothetical protein
MKTIKSHYPPVISFYSVGMKSLIEELEEFSFRILDGFLVGKKEVRGEMMSVILSF